MSAEATGGRGAMEQGRGAWPWSTFRGVASSEQLGDMAQRSSPDDEILEILRYVPRRLDPALALGSSEGAIAIRSIVHPR